MMSSTTRDNRVITLHCASISPNVLPKITDVNESPLAVAVWTDEFFLVNGTMAMLVKLMQRTEDFLTKVALINYDDTRDHFLSLRCIVYYLAAAARLRLTDD
jgi:hypothetical protein